MLITVFYVLNGLLVLSTFLTVFIRTSEKRFSLSLIQILYALPLLAGEYIYLAYHLEDRAARAILFSEVVFTLVWLSVAIRLRESSLADAERSRFRIFWEGIVCFGVPALAALFIVRRLIPEISGGILGIPKELLPDLLFEPFKTTKQGGTGIGLWQVKKMATSLGSSISAENGEDGGARLLVRLPLMPPDSSE